MNARLPLSLKILGGLLINLVFVGLVSYYFSARDQSGWNMLLTQSVREHVAAIAHALAEDQHAAGDPHDATLLSSYDDRYGVRFSVGDPVPPPSAADSSGPPGTAAAFHHHGSHFHGAGFLHGLPDADSVGALGVRPAHGRSGYDVTAEVVLAGDVDPPLKYVVTAHASGLSSLLLFLGIRHAFAFPLLLLVGSALLWWPFIWNMTRAIGRMREATRQVTAGNFAIQLHEERLDELGALAVDINLMASRLGAHLQGQQQFVADVAHEVISPIARMQIGLGILESHVAGAGRQALADVREDLQGMAEMLEELLLFSRSGLSAPAGAPQNVALMPILSRIIVRESRPEAVRTRVPADLGVLAQPALLERALANLLRNAQRYAGDSGHPIEVDAVLKGSHVALWIRDRGPGVPEAALDRLGEPFYRPDLSRTRSIGGVGLGLAIVRRCVAACGGTVVFRNRPDGGFEAELELPASQSAV